MALRVDRDDREDADYGRGILPWTRPASDGRTRYKPSTRYSGVLGEMMNFGLDSSRNINNFVGTLWGRQDPLGGGLGDSMVGSNPADSIGQGRRRAVQQRGQRPQQSAGQETALPDLQSFLSQAMEILGGTKEVPGVDYDPLRNDARSRSAEYDARLNAMYNQLQGSMRDDGTQLQGSYQTAIDDTAQRAQQSQTNIQGAGDAANERNMQQLQALGLGEAAGNAVAEGRDLNTQIAGSVQDAAARGQISGDQLQANQQSAAQANNSLVGAAGLEGNLQRSRVQSELASLLSQYDMEEQQANQQVAAQNASNRQSAAGQGLNLAQALYGSEWDKINYNDQTAQSIAEMQAQQNQPNKLSQSMAFLQQLMQSPQFAGQDINAILPYIQALGGVGKLV